MKTEDRAYRLEVLIATVLLVAFIVLLFTVVNTAAAQTTGVCAPPTNHIYEQNGQQYIETSYPSCGQMGSAKYVQPYYGQSFATSAYLPLSLPMITGGQIIACGQPSSHTYTQNDKVYIETTFPGCGDVSASKFVELYYGQPFAVTGQVAINSQVLGVTTPTSVQDIQQPVVGQRYGAGGVMFGPTNQEAWGRITRATAVTRMPLCEMSRTLSTGMRGDDIRCLQQFLNWSGYTVSVSGPGSRGLETDYYGPLTAAAVMRWQNENNAFMIAPGLALDNNSWGYVSTNRYLSLARAYLNLQ